MDLHKLALGLAAAAAGVPQLEAAFPAAATPYLKATDAILILAVGVLTAIVGTTAAAAKAKLAAGGAK